MYDPTVGRFLNLDPIGFEAGDPNRERYVKNAPTNATDPSGLQQELEMLRYSRARWDRHYPKRYYVFEYFPYDYLRVGWGCGGVAAYRVFGPKGFPDEGPEKGSLKGYLIFQRKGVKVYSSLTDGVAALRDGLGGRGLIVAFQNTADHPFRNARTAAPITTIDPTQPLSPADIVFEHPGSGNFSSLLGSPDDWYWEYANHGWTSLPWWMRTEEQTRDLWHARITRSQSLPALPYTVFLVVPDAYSTSPAPPIGTFTPHGSHFP
jgi:hypothetical protein